MCHEMDEWNYVFGFLRVCFDVLVFRHKKPSYAPTTGTALSGSDRGGDLESSPTSMRQHPLARGILARACPGTNVHGTPPGPSEPWEIPDTVPNLQVRDGGQQPLHIST